MNTQQIRALIVRLLNLVHECSGAIAMLLCLLVLVQSGHVTRDFQSILSFVEAIGWGQVIAFTMAAVLLAAFGTVCYVGATADIDSKDDHGWY